jgi:hypothetical protein
MGLIQSPRVGRRRGLRTARSARSQAQRELQTQTRTEGRGTTAETKPRRFCNSPPSGCEALRVVDNVRTTRPDLLRSVHSREPGGRGGGGTCMRIEVKSIAFGMRRSRYSLHPMATGRGQHVDGAPRGQCSEAGHEKTHHG